MRNLIDYIKECYEETKIYDIKEMTYNQNYYRGANHAYKPLLTQFKNHDSMYSWAWRHKYLGYFSRKKELHKMVKEYQDENPMPVRPNEWVVKIKAWIKKRKGNKKSGKKKGCPQCHKSENIRYVRNGLLKCTECNLFFTKEEKV